MTERPRPQQETESKGAKAERIYTTLLANKNSVTLYYPGVIFVTPHNEVHIWKPTDEKQRITMIERGLLPEDLTRGIVNIKLGHNDKGPFKQIGLTPNNELKAVTIHHGGNPEQKLLHQADIPMMRAALTVAAAPLEIATAFGSYDAFRAELSTETDMTFLEALNEPDNPKASELYRAGSGIYRIGLKTAVRSTQHEGSDYQTTAKIATDFLTQLTKAEQTGKI